MAFYCQFTICEWVVATVQHLDSLVDEAVRQLVEWARRLRYLFPEGRRLKRECKGW